MSQRRGGGSGIRTHGELPHTRFPSVPIRPLSHPSERVPDREVEGVEPWIVQAGAPDTLRPRTVLSGESVVP